MKTVMPHPAFATPLVAILRGLQNTEARSVGQVLVEAGFTIIEVPLNSPEPLKSIQLLSDNYGEQHLIGAGTVTRVAQVQAVKDAGGEVIVSPNTNTEVIKETKRLGMISMPGCYTPSEAFAAVEAGADALKFFPAENIPPTTIKAMKSVLPAEIPIFVVGGIHSDNMLDYLRVGVTGFGIGSSLYKSGKTLEKIKTDAQNIIWNFQQAQEKLSAEK